MLNFICDSEIDPIIRYRAAHNNFMEKSKSRAVITVVVITAFITTFTGSALNMSIPEIGREFNVSAASAGWLITGYTLSVAAFSVPLGRLADITSRRKILIAGISVFVICCIAATFSVSPAMLMISRIAQGVGAAMIFSTNTAVLISSFPESMRGKVLGYSIAATYVGLSAGPVIGGLLNYHFGWRSIFVLTGSLGIISFFAALFKLPRENEDKLKPENEDKLKMKQKVCYKVERNLRHGIDSEEWNKVNFRVQHEGSSRKKARAAGGNEASKYERFDLPGNILYALFIVMLMYGLSEVGRGYAPLISAFAGIGFGLIFVLREMKAAYPVVDISLFRKNAGYACSNVSALLNYGATFAISYLISIYLQVVMGYSSQAAGLIMICQPAIMAGLSPVTGRISDKFSPFKISSLGMAFCAVGIFIFIFLGTDTHLALVIAALVVTGFGFSLFSSPNANAVMSCVKETDYGVASSILATMRSIGNTLSMVIVTAIVNGYMGSIPLADAPVGVLIKVMRISFSVFTGICAAGVFISLKHKE